MNGKLNDSAAHLALCDTVNRTAARIGAHFHKPAPVRAYRRGDARRAAAADRLGVALCVAGLAISIGAYLAALV